MVDPAEAPNTSKQFMSDNEYTGEPKDIKNLQIIKHNTTPVLMLIRSKSRRVTYTAGSEGSQRRRQNQGSPQKTDVLVFHTLRLIRAQDTLTPRVK